MRNIYLVAISCLLVSSKLYHSQHVVLLALNTVVYLQTSSADSCYLFPTDLADPCRNHVCQYGARCVPSADGRNVTCQCPLSCPNYGDHSRSGHVCGSDGKVYLNQCELKRTACTTGRNISVKYEGYCGKLTFESYAEIANIAFDVHSSFYHTLVVGKSRYALG